jgi:hypothetical protein
MADLFLLSEAQMRRIDGYFPLLHGIARVDDRRIVSAIVFVIKGDFVGATRPRSMARTRRSITASSAGAGWACSTIYSPHWPS